MGFTRIEEFLSGRAGSFCLEVFKSSDTEQAVWRALDESERWHKRHCALTAPLVVWTVVAMSVFRSLSIANAFTHVLEANRGNRPLSLKEVVTPEALYHARSRLGWEPLQLLAQGVLKTAPNAGFLAFRPYAVDGFTVDVPDRSENVVGFGRQMGSRGPAAFPQLKGVGLLDVSSRQFVDCVWGPWNMSEFVGAEMLLTPETLGGAACVFLDRRFTKVELWHALLDRKIHFVHRLSSCYHPQITEQQGDGDWLFDAGRWVEIPPEERTKCPGRGRERKRRWETRTLRLIQYRVGELETVQLITDLLDPIQYPAREIALGYHLRWEVELAIDEVKTHLSTVQHGTTHTTFRSQTPRGVIQEAWALIAAYNLIRGLMVEAGEMHDVDPIKISFVDTLEVVRMALPRLQSCSGRQRPSLYRQMLQDIANSPIDRPRRKRWAPRVVKQKVGTFLKKRTGHRSIKRDYEKELILVGSG